MWAKRKSQCFFIVFFDLDKAMNVEKKKLSLPSQTDLLIPLLQSISDQGGAATPKSLYAEVAKRVGVSSEVLDIRVKSGDQDYSIFERRLRWTRQTGILKSLISNDKRGVWALTQKAKSDLKNMVRGTVLTIFETDMGYMLWGNAEDVVGCVEKGSLNVILTSPPYPLVKPRDYGNLAEKEWVEDMLRHCERWRGLLVEDGSMFLNIGACWIKGSPVQTLHVERLLIRLEDNLGLHRLQEFYVKTDGLGGALEWVGKRRIRVKNNVEKMIWLSGNPFAKANNRGVLIPYSKSGLRSIAKPEAHDGRERPSGYKFGKRSFVDNGGAIPSTLIKASNAGSNNKYRKACRDLGISAHPATFPDNLPRFAFGLASDPGDIVADFMAGSGTSGKVAHEMGRHFICSERSLDYIDSARINFKSAGIPTRDISILR